MIISDNDFKGHKMKLWLNRACVHEEYSLM